MLATILTAFKDALTSGMSGTSRPANIKQGGMWIDTTNESTALGSRWSFKIYTGTIDIEVFRLSVSTSGQYGGTIFGDSEFDVQHIAADAVQAYVEFVKQRIIGNGQILNGDTVMEIDWIGTNNLGASPTVAYLRFTATDDQTTSSYGGTLSFASTPDATNAITEHFRLISGYFETVKPHKMNSQRHVSQNVATTGSPIITLSASARVVEFTGSTATDVQGMDATGASQVVTIHNRSSAVVTIRHQNAGATAANRFQLPKGRDLAIPAQGTAMFYYCVADTRWKAKDIPAMVTKLVRTLDTVKGITSTWAAPSTVSEVSIVTYPRCNAFQVGDSGANGAQVSGSLMIGPSGEPYAWGSGANGNLGDGTLIPKSSPVAVLGSHQFIPTNGEDCAAQAAAESSVELDLFGNAWCWGQNQNGQLGNGAVAVASSPVAVLGNLRFSAVYQNPRNGGNGTTFYGLTPNGTLLGWGSSGVLQGSGWPNINAPVSSPVAVLGGLKFSRFYSTGLQHIGLQTDGTAYTWGAFTIGATGGGLGVGDTLGRSSPVAVLGGLKFQKVVMASLGGPNSQAVFLGLTTAGAAYLWGGATFGFGSSVQAAQSSPVAVVGGLTFTDVFATYVDNGGTPRFWAITSDGTPYAWGGNTPGSGGYLGIGNAGTNASSPVAVIGGLKFKKIIPFNGGAFGLQSDGTLYGWGINTNGNLGIGDVNPRSSPVAVLGGFKFDDVVVDAGLSVMGLTTDGNLVAWGENAIGQLGLGDLVARSSPVAVLGGMTADTRSSRGTRITIPVTAGSNYTVNLGHGNCTFGGQLIGTDIERITIEYDK